MTQEGSEGSPIPTALQTDLKKEPDIGEIQREIVSMILERLKDPRAIDLQYPNTNTFVVARHGADPDYEHGSKRHFIILDKSSLLDTDQICIAATDNRSLQHSMTQGAVLVQHGKGLHSEREIALTRFVQNTRDKLRRNEGTCYLIVLSENLKDFTGTLSIKGRAYPFRRHPPFAGKEGVAPFAERWRNGDFQLADAFIYDTAGQSLDFQEADYREILRTLKTAKVNLEMTRKVAQHEGTFELAKIVSS